MDEVLVFDPSIPLLRNAAYHAPWIARLANTFRNIKSRFLTDRRSAVIALVEGVFDALSCGESEFTVTGLRRDVYMPSLAFWG